MRTPARLRDRVCIVVLLLAIINGAHAAAQEPPPRPAVRDDQVADAATVGVRLWAATSVVRDLGDRVLEAR